MILKFKGWLYARNDEALPWSPVMMAECDGDTGLGEVQRAILEGMREHCQVEVTARRELWGCIYTLADGAWRLIGKRRMVGTNVTETWNL